MVPTGKISFDLTGVQKIPPEGCVLGNPPFLEPAEPELAEPAIVTEPLEPEPIRLETEPNRTEPAVS